MDHQDVFDAALRAVETAADEGVSLSALVAYVSMQQRATPSVRPEVSAEREFPSEQEFLAMTRRERRELIEAGLEESEAQLSSLAVEHDDALPNRDATTTEQTERHPEVMSEDRVAELMHSLEAAVAAARAARGDGTGSRMDEVG